jgi:hypothetical protein
MKSFSSPVAERPGELYSSNETGLCSPDGLSVGVRSSERYPVGGTSLLLLGQKGSGTLVGGTMLMRGDRCWSNDRLTF